MYSETNNLVNEYLMILDEIEENEGELTEDLEKRYDTLLEKASTQADGLADLVKELKHLEEIEREKSAFHQKKAAKLKAEQEELKHQILEFIKEEIPINNETHKFSVRHKRTPKVYFQDFEEVPEQYKEWVPKVHMKEWVKDIKLGKTPKPATYYEDVTEYLVIL